MSLSVFPNQLYFLNSSTAPQILTVTTIGASDTVTASMLDGSYATVSPSSATAVSHVVTFTVTPTGTAPASIGGDDGVIIKDGASSAVIAVAVGGAPTSKALLPPFQTLTNAIAYVRAICDLPTTPTDAVITSFLNEGAQQLSDEIEPLFNDIAIPVIDGSSTATLPYDVQDIVALRYSTNPPGQPGGIEYELLELGTLEFVDSTQGMPQMYGGPSAGGPVLWFRRITDQANRIRIELSPQPPPGYLRLAYYVRPILWNINNETGSVTNVDTAYVRLAILFAAKECCRSRKDLVRYKSFEDEYQQLLVSKKEKIGRRRRQRRAVVRDVTSLSDGYLPNWWPGQ
jgi:hypothetical protein